MKKNESKAKELGKEAAPPTAGAPTADHADAEQDKALFAQMIKQYLDKDQADQEEMDMAQHAYQTHREDGMSHEAAYEAAGKHLKMAMKIGKKMAAKHAEMMPHEDETPPPNPKADAPSTKAHEAHHEDESESEAKKEKKESAFIQLSAEVAKLRESVKSYELRDYLDKKLSESKKPNSVTKKFREALGTPKSKEHIDHSFKIFMAAYEAKSEDETPGFAFVEKSTVGSIQIEGKTGSFSDCF